MKIIINTVFFLFTAISVFSQQYYDKGYYIDNNNIKTECLIKNTDSKRNPKQLTIRQNQNSTNQILDIEDVSEFEIPGYARYIRASVKIDVSPTKINELLRTRNPIWKDSLVFLKLLVDGDTKLYSYSDGYKTQFFYNTPKYPIEQLIYKQFRIGNQVGINYGYKQQLLTHFKSDVKSEKQINFLRYIESDLVRFFKQINGSENITSSIVKVEREIINFKFSAGIEQFNLSLTNYFNPSRNVNYKNRMGYRMGFETEYFLPFNKNKISLLFEPSFQYINQSTESYRYENVTLKYSGIDLPLGVRFYHYFGNHGLFFDGHFVPNLYVNLNSKITFTNTVSSYNLYPNMELLMKPSPYLSFGLGYSIKRSSLELRWNSNRDLFTQYIAYATNFTKFSLIYSFKFYNIRN